MTKRFSSDNLRLIFGMKVKNFRLEKGLSLVQLARTSGVAVSYLSEIEQGKKYPKPEKMIRLAEALQVPYDELVSLRVDEKLDPLTTLMGSELVQEFPFDLFGIAPRDILNLFSDSPEKATAFLQTFLEISRTYDMSVENFLLAALRTYQKIHGNHFPDLEAEAQRFLALHSGLPPIPGTDDLATILTEEYGYRIDEHSLAAAVPLAGFRSVYRDGHPPTLFINPRLLPSQKAFVLGREIGFRFLKIHAVRPATSSWLKVESFDHLIHNFQASYFAGALRLPQDRLKADLGHFLAQPVWHDKLLGDLLDKHQATPEMFLYRMSQLLPGEFGIGRLFYLRFTRDLRSGETRLTKELNLTDELVPYGLGLNEHYCRRWLPLQQLENPPAAAGAEADGTPVGTPRIGIQRARFIDSGHRFLMISVARPLALSGAKLSAMTIGFRLDADQRHRIGFADDPAIPAMDVNETCERCPLAPDQCAERGAPPVVHEQHLRQQEREAALQRFLAE